jgi:hypothetical protein
MIRVSITLVSQRVPSGDSLLPSPPLKNLQPLDERHPLTHFQSSDAVVAGELGER